MNTVPIVRIEIDQMRHALHVALGEHAALLNEALQQAVDSFVTPENIERIINETAKPLMESLVKDEIVHFFRYGDGRRTVAAVVRSRMSECLDRRLQEMGLDEKGGEA